MKGNDLELIDKSEMEGSMWYSLIPWDSKVWESSWSESAKKEEQGGWISCAMPSPSSYVNELLHGFPLEIRGKSGTILIAKRTKNQELCPAPSSSHSWGSPAEPMTQKYGTLLKGTWRVSSATFYGALLKKFFKHFILKKNQICTIW